MMHHKIQLTIESMLIGIAIHWQPVFGIAASIAAIVYYGAMLKMNVVDKTHAGSWKQYFKSFFKF